MKARAIKARAWMVIKASIVLNCKIGCILVFIITSRLAVIGGGY